MGKWFSVLAFIATVIFPAVPVRAAITDTVMFNEIRLGGESIKIDEETSVKEYVTLYNGGAEIVSLDGWMIEYAKKPTLGLDPQFCEASAWTGFSNITVTSVNLFGELLPGAVSKPIDMQLNDSGGGSLRLVHVDEEKVTVQDLVGWGEDVPCKEIAATNTPSKDKSLLRYVDCETMLPIDTNDNKNDFATNQSSVPGKIGTTSPEDCEDEQPETDDVDCENIAVTEVLPNPAGVDTGKEFIEIYNPTNWNYL